MILTNKDRDLKDASAGDCGRVVTWSGVWVTANMMRVSANLFQVFEYWQEQDGLQNTTNQ